MARFRHNIWLYLLLMVFVFGLTAQAAGEEPPGVKTKFKDVRANDSNAMYINYVSQRGIINGFPDGSYHPTEGLTRAQAATVMVKAGGLQTGDTANLFKDVAPSYWAAGYISAASKAGYISGFPDGTFRPEEKLTRAQAMSMVMRLCTVKTADQLPVLEDMERNHWAASAMGSALAVGMTGTSADRKKVFPDAELSRAGLARALAILLTKDPGLYKTPLYGTVTNINGIVSITRNGVSSALNEEARLNQGDMLTTGKNSSARINYPDGSSTMIDADSEIYVKVSTGREYIKKDGSPGTAVDFLNVDLKKGTLFGALATKHEIDGSTKEQAVKPAKLAALPSFRLAAAEQAPPWYKTAEAKKVKVKVDMPWGVAAVRGTFIKASVYADGTCKVSCLTGSAELSGSTGSGIPLGEGESSSITGQGEAAGQAAGLSAEEKAAFAEQQVQSWVLETAINMDMNQAAGDTQAVVEVSVEVNNVTNETTVQAIIDAFQSSGITLDSQVIQSIKDQLETLNTNITIDNGNSPGNNQSNNSSSDSSVTVADTNYATAGTYGPASGVSTITGNVNIMVAGVNLQNTVITGNLTLAAGIGDGDVTLSNVTVQGATYVYGGGSSSVHLNSCSLVNVIVDRENSVVRIVASGTTSVGSLLLNSGATLQESGLSGTAAGFSNVSTGIDLPPGLPIILSGNFDAVSITVPGLNIQVEGGSVGQISIGQNAAGTSLTLGSGSSVGTLSVNAATNVGGTGTINSATISVTGVTMAQTPASLQVSPGVSATVGGEEVIGTSTNNAPSTPVITMTPDASSGITTTTAVTITASSTDPDGDVVTYTWSGRSAEIGYYSSGTQVVMVTAIDEHGASSESAAIVFVVTSGEGSQATGGMTLTGPKSRIYENGIAGGNVTGYTFNVPKVSGHYGQDYAWVKGLNANTGQWDTLDFAYTENGIAFSRTITSGQLYNRLELYYYTDHTCMYNLSNIVYSTQYGFGNTIPAEAAPIASNVTIVSKDNGTTLVGCYDFNDANGDQEKNVTFGIDPADNQLKPFTDGTSTYQWYVSADSTGENKQLISGATSRTYTVAANDSNYYFFEVTPIALSGANGAITGSTVMSSGTTVSNAGNLVAAELSAVSSATSEDALVTVLHRLNMSNVAEDRKAFYWAEKQVAITTLNDIQANLVDSGNTAANVRRASGLRIYAGSGEGGNVSSQVLIYVVDQFGWDINTPVTGVTVSVTGGTIASVNSGTVTSGTVGGQELTLDTASAGTGSVIGLTLSMDPAAQTVTVSASSPAAGAVPALTAHPINIVAPILSSMSITLEEAPAAGAATALVAVLMRDQNGNNLYGMTPNVQVTVAGGTAKIASIYSVEGYSYGTLTGGSLGSQSATFSTCAQGVLGFYLTLDAPADQTVTINATNGTLTATPASVNFSTIATSPLASYTPVALSQTGSINQNNVQYQNAAAVINVLPATVAVTLANQSAVNVPVTWADTDVYNAATASSYTFTATWGAMPVGANNSNNLAAPTLEVIVAQGATLSMVTPAQVAMTETGTVSGSDVQYQTAAEVVSALGSTVSVTLEDQSAANVSITWTDPGNYNAAVPGTYAFTGAWGALPAGVDNDGSVNAPIAMVTVLP